MYDYNFHDENNHTQHAFRWIAHDESNQFMAFHKLNLARNYSDYMAALNEYDAPAQNFAFASAGGDIAIRVQGKYPVRRTNEGKFILDGSKSTNGWMQYIPDEQNVVQKNPARGFVSSANQYPVDATYPYYITSTHYEAYRNRRINTLLQQATNVTPEDMIRMQVDNYNLRAAESLPLFLKQLDSAHFNNTEAAAFRTLKQWNYVNDKDSEGASYFQAWWDNLMPLIWDELDKNHILLTRPTRYTTIKLIREQPALSFFDIQSTPEKETAKEVIQKSFALGVKDLEEWKAKKAGAQTASSGQAVAPWSEYKDSYIGHLLRLPALSEHVLTGGNYDIVNAHSKVSGPSWRMVVSLEKSGVKAWGLYPGGQSGNPGSAHYIDMLDHWVHGKSYPLLFMHSADEAAAQKLSRTQFNPESK
jgi:penicillin amidase